MNFFWAINQLFIVRDWQVTAFVVTRFFFRISRKCFFWNTPVSTYLYYDIYVQYKKLEKFLDGCIISALLNSWVIDSLAADSIFGLEINNNLCMRLFNRGASHYISANDELICFCTYHIFTFCNIIIRISFTASTLLFSNNSCFNKRLDDGKSWYFGPSIHNSLANSSITRPYLPFCLGKGVFFICHSVLPCSM